MKEVIFGHSDVHLERWDSSRWMRQGLNHHILKILCDERPYHWITNDWLLSSAMIKKPPYIWPDPDSFVNRIASCFEMDPERRPSSSELLK